MDKKRVKIRSRMLSIARQRLAVGVGKKQKVFAACAAHLGTEWDGTKDHGYDLVYRVVAKHKGTPLRALPKALRAAKAAPNLHPNALPAFLETYQWRRLRMKVLVARGARCECCGATPKDGIRVHVDHIKPRRLYPELALEETNLQVLCEVCNHGKGNWDQTDWRPETAPVVMPPPVPPSPTQCVADPMRPRLVRRAQGA